MIAVILGGRLVEVRDRRRLVDVTDRGLLARVSLRGRLIVDFGGLWNNALRWDIAGVGQRWPCDVDVGQFRSRTSACWKVNKASLAGGRVVSLFMAKLETENC